MKSQRFNQITGLLAGILLCLLISKPALGQDFRLFTKVFDLSFETEKPPVISRSLSLFHAGKVYDYIDTTGEVTIYEPAKKRFLILDTQRDIVTIADLDEIKHHLKVAHKVTLEHINSLKQKKSKNAEDQNKTMNAIEHLVFQLNPKFETKFDATSNQLILQGTGIRYSATATKNESKELVDSFVKFTDWTARLNYVLHPRAVFPASRLVLNEQIKIHQLIPTSVELKTAKMHLKAEHQIQWSLAARDRSLIHRWNRQLKSKSIKTVTLREYQRIVLASGKN